MVQHAQGKPNQTVTISSLFLEYLLFSLMHLVDTAASVLDAIHGLSCVSMRVGVEVFQHSGVYFTCLEHSREEMTQKTARAIFGALDSTV